MSVSFLIRQNAPSLAYIKKEGSDDKKPIIMFLTGLASDMMGSKASYIDDVCSHYGFGYVRFDFRGHGQSHGTFKDGTIGLWLEDAMAIFDMVLCGREIYLVGSSMGGWISLLLARARAERVKGLIGLAAAPDFTKDIKQEMTTSQKNDLEKNGYFILPSDYGTEGYSITKSILEDGDKHCLLDAPLNIHCPVRLIQGKKDADVEWTTAQRIYDVLTTPDKKIIYRPAGDHRLSTPEDLDVLKSVLLELVD